MSDSEAASTGAVIYGELAKDELAGQEARKNSLEQRGLAVVSTSGALVTLLFGLGALSTRAAQTFVLPDPAPIWLGIALVLFVLAAVAALATNVPLRYEPVTADAIRGRLKESPIRSEADAHRDIALTRVKTLRVAKAKNTIKSRLLITAMTLEVAAVACVGVAIWIVIDP